MTTACSFRSIQVSSELDQVFQFYRPLKKVPPSHPTCGREKDPAPTNEGEKESDDSSLQLAGKGDCRVVLCSPTMQGSDWKRAMTLPRKSVESKKNVNACCMANKHLNAKQKQKKTPQTKT